MMIKDFFWSFFGQTGVMALKAIFQIYFLTLLPLEYFASFFQTSSIAAILCIVSSLGIPAFYARNRLRASDKFIFNYYLNFVSLFNFLMTLLAFFAYFILIENLLSVEKLIFLTSLFIILLSGPNQMFKAYFFKRNEHKKVGIISFSSFLVGGSISLFIGYYFSKDLILPTYIILPMFIETTLLKMQVSIKILQPSLKISRKTRQFLKYDVLRNLLNSSFSSLLIATFSFIFQERDLAILGLCATWVNRSILLVNGVLKQVFYPILVRENARKVDKSSTIHMNLSLLNVGVSSICLLTLILFTYLDLWLSYEYSSVYFFLIGSILINCTTPIIDTIKAKGRINILFWTSLIVSLFYYFLIIVYIQNITLVILINLYIFSSIFSMVIISLLCFKVLKFFPIKVLLFNSILVASMLSSIMINSIYIPSVIITLSIMYQLISMRVKA